MIPYNMDDVKLDYHVLGKKGKSGKKIEVLVTVVKNEIISSFVEAFMLAGLDVAVVDVDYFALQNCFELAYPEMVEETTALVQVGARHTSVNICKDGKSLFVGTIPIGGNTFSDMLVEELGISDKEAEAIKTGRDTKHEKYNDALSLISVKIEEVSSEFNRQLSMFWNASGSSEGINSIIITGGGALLPGFTDAIAEKTGLEVEMMNPVRALDVDEDFDADYMLELSPFISLCAGLCERQPGDKIVHYDD